MAEQSTPDNGNVNSGDVVGTLEDAENKALWNLRRAADDIIREVGQLEVRKARLLGSLGQVEERAQAILNKAADRIGIPKGQVWHASADGTIRLGAGGPVSQQE